MSVPTVTIRSNQTTMPVEYELLALEVCSSVNRVPWAMLSLLDGDSASQSFAISDGAFFEPGKEIEISVRYEGEPGSSASIFKGVVVRHALEAGAQGCLLNLEMKDASLKMTRARKSCVYYQQSDSQIMQTLIGQSGLSVAKLDATDVSHAEITQYYCSDWDFLLARAQANGMLVASHQGSITLAKIDLAGAPRQKLEFGISEILDFDMEVDARHQYAEIESIAWDLESQKLTQASKAQDFNLAQGNLNPANVAKLLGGERQTLSEGVPQAPKVVQAWADAAMASSRLGMLRGRIGLPGMGQIQCLDLIEVAGVGKRFNGRTLVTGVRHRVDTHGWRTDVQFGLAPLPANPRGDVMDLPAGGQLPGVNGLQIGVVSNYDDPDKLARVQVTLPMLGAQKNAVWARLASPDAGNGRGMVFRPEPGDEVVVGFFNDDPRQAVILGGMFSSSQPQPEALGAAGQNNRSKGLVTRSGILLGLDDEKAQVLIQTPGNNKIVIDDEAKSIQLADQHGNSISMSADGIEIKSAKDLKFSASGAGDFKFDGKLDVASGGNVVLKGSAVDIQ